MNFLAHLFLSGQEEHLVVGNFLGDFIKNREVENLPPPFQKGVFLHRQIDSYTDNHPVVRKGAKRLRPVHRKYAPVILDVLYDFVLAQNWERYCQEDIQDWAKKTYSILQNHLHLMPPFLQKRLPLMIADNWLVRYGTEDGLRFTFSRMKLRASLPLFFEKAVESLQKDYPLFEAEFNSFFPDVIAFVKKIDFRHE